MAEKRIHTSSWFSVGLTARDLLAYDATRQYLLIQNNHGADDVGVAFGGKDGVTADSLNSLVLGPGEMYAPPYEVMSSVSLIKLTGSETAQVETLTLSGTVTATGDLTLAGKTISVTALDTSDTVAGLLATALAADPEYASANAVGSVITVTYASGGLRPEFPDETDNGISLVGAVTTPGVGANCAIITA